MSEHDQHDAIRAWFQDGPTRGPERGLDETLARLATARQSSQPEIRLPLWVPAAALLALLLAALLAFGAGFRITRPAPATSVLPTTQPTTSACRLDVPVHGRDAVLVGTGFAPDADVHVDIDRASAGPVTLFAHTDRTGGFSLGARPYAEDLGIDHVTATAGCTATLDIEVTQSDLPPACPDPGVPSAPIVNGPAYRAAVAADEPLAWWRFDETGSVAQDSAGSHPGTYVSQMEHAALSPLSDGGAAYFHHQFPGTAIVQLDPIVLHGDFAVETWALMCHWFDGDAVFGSETSAATLKFGEGELVFNDGVRDLLYAGAATPEGVWQHHVLVRSGDRLALYLNGELQSSADATGWTGDLPISKLGSDAGGENLLGYLDEVALYDHALSPERIAAHTHP